MIERRRIIINAVRLAALTAIAVGLAGCGNKKASKNDIASSLQQTEAEATDTNAGAYEARDIPEHVNYTLEDNNGNTVDVDASISIPTADMIPTYSFEEVELNDENLAEFAENFFDNGEYEAKKPYSTCSVDELQEEENYNNSIIDQLGGLEPSNQLSYDITKLNRIKRDYDESTVINKVEGKLFYPDDYSDTYNDIYPKYRARLLGKVDGDDWQLRAEYDDAYDDIYITPVVQKDDYDMEVREAVETSVMFGGNTCSYTKEQAEGLAADMVERLGFTDFGLIHTSQTGRNTGESAKMNGYYFAYGFCDGDMRSIYSSGDCVYTDVYRAHVQSYVEVFVDSYGVEKIHITHIYKKLEKLSVDTELLDFQQIDNIAQSYYNQYIIEYYSSSSFVSDIKLCYACVNYDGVNCMIPVWAYYSSSKAAMSEEDEVYCDVAVNAIDGSIIYQYYAPDDMY